MFAALSGYRQYKKLPEQHRQLVFYAESRHDWHHFSDIISSLVDDYQHHVVYLTSDKQDLCFAKLHPHFHCYYIGEGWLRTWLFQFLQAKLMVLTVMDLNNFQLKRSINPVHYMYLFHSPGSTHRADFANSYDHYDSILCVGPYHMQEIRRREEMANLPNKELLAHGYQRLEKLHALGLQHTSSVNSEKPCVLIAPTWGGGSLVDDCALPLIEHLLADNFRVIFRPHYQTVKLNPKLIDRILSKHGQHPHFDYITLMGESQSLLDADILIADWSAIAIEFALALCKPVLFIDVPPRVRNPDWQHYKIPVMESEIRSHIGQVLSVTDIANAGNEIRQLLANKAQLKEHIAELREKHIFNFGQSHQVAAKEIDRKFMSLKTTENSTHVKAKPNNLPSQ